MTPQSDHNAPVDEEFEIFFRSTVERTFRTARRMARGDRQAAWRVTQDGYARVLREWDSRRLLPAETNARFAAGVAVRRLVEADRLPGQRTSAENDGDGWDAAALDDRPVPQAVRELLDRQPVRQRAAAVLFFLGDLEPAEIADALALPEPTVRNHLDQVRVLMKPLVDGGHP